MRHNWKIRNHLQPFYFSKSFYNSIKITIFKTLRRLNTTWNFACSITRDRALRTLFVHTEFTKKRVFEQLTLAVACSAGRCPASREVWVSECAVTWKRVKVEHYCNPATTIHAVSHVTFPAFDFSIVSYMRLLFQLQGQYCFSLTTNNKLSVHLYGTKLWAWSTLTLLHVPCPIENEFDPKTKYGK